MPRALFVSSAEAAFIAGLNLLIAGPRRQVLEDILSRIEVLRAKDEVLTLVRPHSVS